jgi:regulatory protein
MTIISIKSGTGGEFRRIELSDGSIFSFKPCYLPPVFLDDSLYTPGAAEGREINADEEAAFRFASSCLRAEKAALQLIARAEQSVFGLSRKLKKRGHDSACVRSVISRLAELELVDDSRYARLWLESRINRKASSPRRLLVALCARGIDHDDAESVLKTALDAETEWQLLLHYTNKQRRLRKAVSPETGGNDLRSLKYALKSEGFSTEAIQRFIEQNEEE